MKKWKWLIIEVVCIVAGVLGFYLWSMLKTPSSFALLAMIFGLYWAGYAACRLEANMRDIKVHVEVKGWKPHITVTPLEQKSDEA